MKFVRGNCYTEDGEFVIIPTICIWKKERMATLGWIVWYVGIKLAEKKA